MPRDLWPAHEERTADDRRHAAANRAYDKVRRGDVRLRAQDATATKRAKDNNAGQPGTENAALPARSRDVKRARNRAGKNALPPNA